MIILCNHIMDLWKKVFRSELSFRKEGTCRRPLGLIRKSVKLRYCSGSSLPKVLSNTTAQKITADARKQKKSAVESKVWKTTDRFTGYYQKWHSDTDSPQKTARVSERLFQKTPLGSCYSRSSFLSNST